MARRRRAEKRVPPADIKYGSVDLSQFINRVMLHGKKTIAQKIVYGALERIEQESNRPGLEIFEQAIRNTTPMLEVKSRRVGGATYQVPTEVRPERRLALAMRWIIASARNRGNRPTHISLANELLEAARNQGSAVRRREELHRMADANRAFAHYRW
jgi:small subunit ribosomal protein S7